MVKKERLAHLRSQYLFECSCVACVNDFPLYDPDSSEEIDFEIDENVTANLLKADTSTVKNELPRLLEIAERLDMSKSLKSVLEIQEYLKQCYSVLGNKRCLL